MSYNPIIHNGIAYLVGTAGSLIIECPTCGVDHFRCPDDYFRNPSWHNCFNCQVPMNPIRMYELNKWKRFWHRLFRVGM